MIEGLDRFVQRVIEIAEGKVGKVKNGGRERVLKITMGLCVSTWYNTTTL